MVNQESTDDELSKGTFACPVCGLGTPHSSDAHKTPGLPEGLCDRRFTYDETTHICGLKSGHGGKHACKDCRLEFGYQYGTQDYDTFIQPDEK